MFSVSLLPAKTTSEPGELIELFGTVYADSTPIGGLKVILKINGILQKEGVTDNNGSFKFETSFSETKTYYAYVEAYVPEKLVEEFSKLGDVNSDGVIDDKDTNLIKEAFGSTPDSPNWNPKCDLNRDGVIDAKDFRTVSFNYGLTLEEWLKKR
jgi:hypothetical protein